MIIRINLLPHREEAKKQRKQQFVVLCALSVFVAAIVVFAANLWIDGLIAEQNEANQFLKDTIANLDKEIDQIKKLKEQTKALLARKEVIENLQRDRGDTVHLMNEMVSQVPEGIFLKSLKQDGLRISLTGYAQSNARVSALMRNLEASPWLENPQLIEVKAGGFNGRRVNEFSMDVTLTRVIAQPAQGGS